MRTATALLFLATLALPTLSLRPCAAATDPTTGADATATERAALELVRIWPGWRSADSFLRLSEYFGGGENRSGQTILRSQPSERGGFYFLTRIKNPGAEWADVRFELQVIRPDSPHAKTYTFAATLTAGSHAYNLGLTGSDWTGWDGKSPEDTQPVAWRLRLLDAQGRELLSKSSFLWRTR
ncbi:hypothetical protein AXK11_01900 [Cephaloticoccus primus]|uniref:Uncharacterized protein n=1 Tax=Cephaloticoccus primus TaxID=1548207 RepID=A0A139STL3_9BACT|nr:hypothetical protein [Cephaloticoccus primus]KXU37923.1 hypothetical protein AXK11_01900 [Cephaloticoccus primus]